MLSGKQTSRKWKAKHRANSAKVEHKDPHGSMGMFSIHQNQVGFILGTQNQLNFLL